MSSKVQTWPDGLAPDALCLTVDVEWAHPIVLADLVALFDAAGVAGTFFVTHQGITLPGHERGLHPNFRRNGDTYRALLAARRPDAPEPNDEEVHAFVLERTRSFAPEATGLRSHCLVFRVDIALAVQVVRLSYRLQPASAVRGRPAARCVCCTTCWRFRRTTRINSIFTRARRDSVLRDSPSTGQD